MIDTNITATRRLLTALGQLDRVPKLVFTSSLYAYGALGPTDMSEADLPAPTTDYGVSKLAGEHLLRVATSESGLPWTVARLFFIYGPRQYAEGGYKSVIVSNFERMSRGEPPRINGDGQQSLDYLYLDDALSALVKMTNRAVDGLTLNISSGTAVTVAELTARMLKVAKCDLQPVEAPPDWTAGTRRAGDPALARRRLGWVPTVGLDDGLGRVWIEMTVNDG